VEPQSRQYHVALSVVLGRNMDAIVVDNTKTAEECINVRMRSLKQQHSRYQDYEYPTLPAGVVLVCTGFSI